MPSTKYIESGWHELCSHTSLLPLSIRINMLSIPKHNGADNANSSFSFCKPLKSQPWYCTFLILQNLKYLWFFLDYCLSHILLSHLLCWKTGLNLVLSSHCHSYIFFYLISGVIYTTYIFYHPIIPSSVSLLWKYGLYGHQIPWLPFCLSIASNRRIKVILISFSDLRNATLSGLSFFLNCP